MDATAQLRQLYEKFKQLHPNTADDFEPTMEAAQRWRWHIKQAEQKATRTAFENEEPTAEEEATAESRAFKSFEEMPSYMQDQFLLIASHFPGRQVFATGSRTTGEYMEEWSPETVKELRRKLGKKETSKSDYDITFEADPGTDVATLRAALPPGADIVRPQARANKLPIPMWDFSKLPREEHDNVLDLFGRSAWGALMAIHNKYKLSPTVFCCNDGPVKRWFAHAIEQGLVTGSGEETEKDENV